MTHQRSVQLTTLHYQNAELEAQAIFRSESSLPTKKSLLHRSVSRSERRVYFELEVHCYTCFVCGFASFLLINVVELEKSSKWGIGFRVYGIAKKKPKEEERTRRVCVCGCLWLILICCGVAAAGRVQIMLGKRVSVFANAHHSCIAVSLLPLPLAATRPYSDIQDDGNPCHWQWASHHCWASSSSATTAVALAATTTIMPSLLVPQLLSP
jgi:hypothetical protein